MKFTPCFLLALIVPIASHAATVFSDDFSASTLNQTSIPTATSTSYDVASTKAAISGMASGDLKLALNATTSGFVEAQALFASSPITLAKTGDFIELTLTFTATSNILTQGNASLGFGLFNSGGVAPLTNLQNSGLSNVVSSPNATGGAQLWQGFVNRIQFSGSSLIYTRPPQTGTASDNQELLFSGVGGGAFTNPRGTTIVGGGSSLTLTDLSVYTLDFKLTYDAELATLTIESNVFSGIGTTGLNLFTQTGVAFDPNLLTKGFDAVSFGYRFANSPGVASQMDVNSMFLTSNAVPEPSSAALLLGGLACMTLRRGRRSVL